MNIPGFNAEASLINTDAYYSGADLFSARASQGEVSTQSMAIAGAAAAVMGVAGVFGMGYCAGVYAWEAVHGRKHPAPGLCGHLLD